MISWPMAYVGKAIRAHSQFELIQSFFKLVFQILILLSVKVAHILKMLHNSAKNFVKNVVILTNQYKNLLLVTRDGQHPLQNKLKNF